jgi:hypothetical protein
MRLQTAFLNSEARALREKRLAAGLSAPRLALRDPPAPDGLRDRIRVAIRARPGLTLTDMHRATGNNLTARVMGEQLGGMEADGLIRAVREKRTKGRSVTRFFPVKGGSA